LKDTKVFRNIFSCKWSGVNFKKHFWDGFRNHFSSKSCVIYFWVKCLWSKEMVKIELVSVKIKTCSVKLQHKTSFEVNCSENLGGAWLISQKGPVLVALCVTSKTHTQLSKQKKTGLDSHKSCVVKHFFAFTSFHRKNHYLKLLSLWKNSFTIYSFSKNTWICT